MASSKVPETVNSRNRTIVNSAGPQEIQQSSKPIIQQRLSMTPANSGASLPVRQGHSRHHSQSLSAGSFNPNHRVTRRKSVSSNAATNAGAIAAAVREIGAGGISALSMSVPSSNRRHTISRTARTGSISNYPTPPSSLPSHKPAGPSSSIRKLGRSESAIEDDPNEEDEFEEDDSNPAIGSSRMRRASEGQYLIKDDDKKLHGGELKCDKCGKGYKHSSCLTKHLFVPNFLSLHIISLFSLCNVPSMRNEKCSTAAKLFFMVVGSRSTLVCRPLENSLSWQMALVPKYL